MKALLSGVLLLSIVACAKAEPPRAFALTLADTGFVSATCPAAGANTGCLLSAADSLTGNVLWANQPMVIGQTLTATILGSPGQRVVVKGTMLGVAPNVPNSPPAFARAEGTFPFPNASTPTFTLQFIFRGQP